MKEGKNGEGRLGREGREIPGEKINYKLYQWFKKNSYSTIFLRKIEIKKVKTEGKKRRVGKERKGFGSFITKNKIRTRKERNKAMKG